MAAILDGNSEFSAAPYLLQAVEGTPIAYAYQDDTLRYRWVHNSGAIFDTAEVVGRCDSDVLPEDAATAATTAKRLVLDTGRSARLELPIAGENGVRHFDLYLSAKRDGDRVAGVLSVMIEVTAFRRAASTMHLLLRELSHRSKNLLAIVQSLAAQTARTATSTQVFIERFTGRIQSVSHSQDLITDADWRGARLSDLLRMQVHPYVTDASRQVSFAGTDHYLRPNAALYVGLALHELAVNAAQYGAFSRPRGRVEIVVARMNGGAAPEEERDMLRLIWTEHGAPGTEDIDKGEFGHALLARLVPASVGGKATRTFLPDGLRYELTLAKDEFE